MTLDSQAIAQRASNSLATQLGSVTMQLHQATAAAAVAQEALAETEAERARLADRVAVLEAAAVTAEPPVVTDDSFALSDGSAKTGGRPHR